MRRSSRYEVFTETGDLVGRIAELRLKTVVLDVEPFVAYWDSGEAALERGVRATLDDLAGFGLAAVVFATNSTRRLRVVPAVPGAQVRYVSAAHKPLRLRPYRDLPRPGAVIGDQVATDGLLASRLGYEFLHYCPELVDAPGGPRMMRAIGQAIRPLVYRPINRPTPNRS